VPPCSLPHVVPLVVLVPHLFLTCAPVHSCYHLSLFWAFVPTHCLYFLPDDPVANSDSSRYFASCSGSCIRHLYHHHQSPSLVPHICLPTSSSQRAMLHPPPLSTFLPDELEALHLLCGLGIRGTAQRVAIGWGNVFRMEEQAQVVSGALTSFHTPYTFVRACFVILAYENIANLILLIAPCIFWINKNMNTYKYDQGGILKI
jgi:hypothetical protein